MGIDLEKGISLKVEGELGKNQTLSVDSLIRIANSLQELVISIAKFDIDASEAVDLNNFKLELSDFRKSSAVPTFVFSKSSQLGISDVGRQKNEVGNKLSSLLKLSDEGNYINLKSFYPEYSSRNEIVEKLYNFTSSFSDSPVYISEVGNNNQIYRPKKFKNSVKKDLIVKVERVKNRKEVEDVYATVQITKEGEKTSKKIKEIIAQHQHSISYSPEIINVNDKQYILTAPLRCLFEKEDDFYLINNEILEIIGTGETPDEAEINFNEEFDFLFTRLNTLDDSELSSNFIRIKTVLNYYIKEVL